MTQKKNSTCGCGCAGTEERLRDIKARGSEARKG